MAAGSNSYFHTEPKETDAQLILEGHKATGSDPNTSVAEESSDCWTEGGLVAIKVNLRSKG